MKILRFDTDLSDLDEKDLEWALKYARSLGAQDPAFVALTALTTANARYKPGYGTTFRTFCSLALNWRAKDDKRLQVRHHQKNVPLIEDLQVFAEETPNGLTQDDRAALALALRALDRGSRRLIYLRFWRGLSFRQIKEKPYFSLSSEVALRARVSRIYTELRFQITRHLEAA